MNAPTPRYLTTSEAAAYCRYPSGAHLLRAESHGLIRGAQRGRLRLWRRDDLDELLAIEPLQRLGSFVYFIEAVGAERIKIGFARNPDLRLSALAQGCPFPLRLLAEIPGGWLEEQELHRRFAHLRRHGEWFAAAPDLRAFVSSLGEPEI